MSPSHLEIHIFSGLKQFGSYFLPNYIQPTLHIFFLKLPSTGSWIDHLNLFSLSYYLLFYFIGYFLHFIYIYVLGDFNVPMWFPSLLSFIYFPRALSWFLNFHIYNSILLWLLSYTSLYFFLRLLIIVGGFSWRISSFSHILSLFSELLYPFVLVSVFHVTVSSDTCLSISN